MKHIKNALLILVLISVVSFGQTYKKGSMSLNVGAGFGLNGVYGDATMPPLSVGLQYGYNDKISVGGIIGYAGSSYDFPTWGGKTYTWDYTYLIIGARGEYHFVDVMEKVDLYAGVTLGYNIVSVSEPSGFPGGYSAESSYLLYGGHAGAKYAVSDAIGIFGEIGYGVGYLTAGVSFKL